MSIREALQHLDMAIQRDHTDRVLCAFLQVILAVEIAIQSDAQVIETLLDPVTQQEHATTIAILRDRDMLSFVSAPPQVAVTSVRILIQSGQSDGVADWYRRHWNQPNWSSELILASIANSLRPVMIIVLGNNELLRRQLGLQAEQLTATQAVIDTIEILRASRTQVQLYLAGKGVEIQAF